VAEETAKHLRMNVTRHPELTARVARNAKHALVQSSANLAEITSGRSTPLPLTNHSDDN
jgi:hypothetical protein